VYSYGGLLYGLHPGIGTFGFYAIRALNLHFPDGGTAFSWFLARAQMGGCVSAYSMAGADIFFAF
jgi:hypothetical protein